MSVKILSVGKNLNLMDIEEIINLLLCNYYNDCIKYKNNSLKFV